MDLLTGTVDIPEHKQPRVHRVGLPRAPSLVQHELCLRQDGLSSQSWGSAQSCRSPVSQGGGKNRPQSLLSPACLSPLLGETSPNPEKNCMLGSTLGRNTEQEMSTGGSKK